MGGGERDRRAITADHFTWLKEAKKKGNNGRASVVAGETFKRMWGGKRWDRCGRYTEEGTAGRPIEPELPQNSLGGEKGELGKVKGKDSGSAGVGCGEWKTWGNKKR